jgi:type IV pilus assembly protein PilX
MPFRCNMLLWSALSPRRQQGFSLVMVLIFLLLLTMLTVSTAQHALLQQRMAGTLRNAQQAQLSAETALRGAEYGIWSKAGHAGVHLHCQQGRLSSDDGCVVYDPLSTPYGAKGDVARFQSATGWVADIGKSYRGPRQSGYTSDKGEPAAVLARNPVYIIEDLGSVRPSSTGSLHESGNTGPNNSGAGEVNIHMYRVTARGAGGNPNVVRVVQSTFDAPVSP